MEGLSSLPGGFSLPPTALTRAPRWVVRDIWGNTWNFSGKTGQKFNSKKILACTGLFSIPATPQIRKEKPLEFGYRGEIEIAWKNISTTNDKVRLLLGAHDIRAGQEEEPGRLRVVSRDIRPHPAFNLAFLLNDIALVRNCPTCNSYKLTSS